MTSPTIRPDIHARFEAVRARADARFAAEWARLTRRRQTDDDDPAVLRARKAATAKHNLGRKAKQAVTQALADLAADPFIINEEEA